MKKIVTLLIFTSAISINAQIKATTDEGKDVVLFENGTWKFVNESDKATLETIKNNPEIFKKNKEATFLVRSRKLDAGLYLNPKEWKISSRNPNPTVEFIFTNLGGENEAVAAMISETVQVPTLKNLKDIVLSSIQKSVAFFRLQESEYRNVNGNTVLYLKYIANLKGLDFQYVAYYQILDGGYLGIACFALQKDYDRYQISFQNSLNGLSFAKKDSSVIKEEIIYSSPPPPMKSK